jgi:hypothetical protein
VWFFIYINFGLQTNPQTHQMICFNDSTKNKKIKYINISSEKNVNKRKGEVSVWKSDHFNEKSNEALETKIKISSNWLDRKF